MLDNKDFTVNNIPIAGYHVSYCLFKDTKKYPWNGINNPYEHINNENVVNEPKEDMLKALNTACFSGLGSYMRHDEYAD